MVTANPYLEAMQTPIGGKPPPRKAPDGFDFGAFDAAADRGLGALSQPSRGLSAPTFDPNRWWDQPGINFYGGGVVPQPQPGFAPQPATQFPGTPGTFGSNLTVTPFAPASARPSARPSDPKGGFGVPDWAQQQFGDDAQGFYNWMQSFQDPDARLAWETNARGAYQAALDEEAARQAGLQYLADAESDVNTAFQAWKSDPTVEGIIASLRGRAEGTDPLLGDRVRAAQESRIAGAYARSATMAEQDAARRGATLSPTTDSTLVGLRGQAEGAGLQANAQIDIANAQDRARATSDLSGFITTREQLDKAYVDAISRIQAGQAALAADVNVEPSDVVPYAQLDFARGAYDREATRLEEQDDAVREAQEWDWQDTLNVGLNLVGNFPGAIAGLFS